MSRTAVALVAAAGSAQAQDISSAQSGDWGDAATWQGGMIPAPTDNALLSHDITYNRATLPGFRLDVNDLQIGATADASLTAVNRTDLRAAGTLTVGLNGFTGTLDVRDSFRAEANNIVLGLSGPASVVSGVRLLDATGAAPAGSHAFVMGDHGFQATVSTERGIRSAGGIRLGADATLVFPDFLSALSNPFLSSTNATPIEFDPATVIDFSETPIIPRPVVGDIIRFASAPGSTVTGAPTILNPLGYLLAPIDSNPERLDLQVVSIPATFDWTAQGGADWLDPSNWSQPIFPLLGGGFVNVRNGGFATLVGPSPTLELNTLTVAGLSGNGAVVITDFDDITFANAVDIGSNNDPGPRPDQGVFGFTGTLAIMNADRIRFSEGIDVGVPRATGTAEVTASGELSITNVNELIIDEDIDLANARASDFNPNDGETTPANGTIARALGTIVLADIGSVYVGEDLDLAEETVDLFDDPGPITIDQNASFFAANITTFTVDGDFDLATTLADERTAHFISGDISFVNIDMLQVNGDIDFVHGGSDSVIPGTLTHRMTLNTTDIDLMQIEGDIDMNNAVHIRGSDHLDIEGRWNITRSNVRLEAGDFAGFGNIDLDGVQNPGPDLTGATGNTISTRVALLESTFTSVDETRFGRATEGAPTEGFKTEIILDDGSRGSSGYLRQGVKGEFVFHIDGLQPATQDASDPNTYPTWSVPFNPALATSGAPAVELNGTVTVDFDITPPAGTHTFDLISTTGTISNAATLAVNDLPAGFSIASFEVVGNSNVQILRLTIADCLADTNNDGQVTPADFNAWVLAFNSQAPECDQNGDGLCTPADFNAWILNFNQGCP